MRLFHSYLISVCCLLNASQICAESLEAEEVVVLVNTGQVVPLLEIIRLHPAISESQLLDVQLEREVGGKLIYQFELLQPENNVVTLEVDAITGQLIREEFEE